MTLEAEGPSEVRRTVKDVDKARHVLHIDIIGPFLSSDDGYSYFLVGALRLPSFPLLMYGRFWLQERQVKRVISLGVRLLTLNPFSLRVSPFARHLASKDCAVIEVESAPLQTLSVFSRQVNLPQIDHGLQPKSQRRFRAVSRAYKILSGKSSFLFLS